MFQTGIAEVSQEAGKEQGCILMPWAVLRPEGREVKGILVWELAVRNCLWSIFCVCYGCKFIQNAKMTLAFSRNKGGVQFETEISEFKHLIANLSL